MCSVFFFFKQKTAYEMRISDWSSDVCSSDLVVARTGVDNIVAAAGLEDVSEGGTSEGIVAVGTDHGSAIMREVDDRDVAGRTGIDLDGLHTGIFRVAASHPRSEEHTYELQSLMRISYAVFCLKKKRHNNTTLYTQSNI